MSSKPTLYAKSTLILCMHDNLYYEAKIVKVDESKKEPIYRVHYKGWNTRYDENITHSDAVSRFIAHTPENIEMADREKAIANELFLKRKRRAEEGLDEETPPASVEASDSRSKFTKPPIPPRVLHMLRTVENVQNLEEKTSIENFLKKYMEENKGFEKQYPNHPAADVMVECLLEQLVLDFNMSFMNYLTKEEMQQCLEIFNKKRVAQDETEVTMEEMEALYEGEESLTNLFENPGINFADIYGVLHLARFLEAEYNEFELKVKSSENDFIKIFHDLLSYADNFTSEYA